MGGKSEPRNEPRNTVGKRVRESVTGNANPTAKLMSLNESKKECE